MNASFVNATHPTALEMNRGGVFVGCAVSASVECFVHERAPTQSLSTASLSRRVPPRRWRRVRAGVEANRLRGCRPRRGSTSEILDGSLPIWALGMRALAQPAKSHSVRPNYAFERTVKSPRNHWRHHAAAQRER
jgi:hypothetical protein